MGSDRDGGIARIGLSSNRKAYRPHSEGVREIDPRPRREGVIVVTKRVAPSIRSTVGWLYPLEHYDETLALSPLLQYAELLLLMGSKGPPDVESVKAVLREARGRLDDREYERLVGYLDILVSARIGISADVP